MPRVALVMLMQLFVQGNGALVGEALHGTAEGVTTEQQVGLASQVAGFYGVGDFALVVQQLHLGAGGDVQAGFDGAAVAQRNAGAGIGAQQAAFAQGNDDVAAAPAIGSPTPVAAAPTATFASYAAFTLAAFSHILAI